MKKDVISRYRARLTPEKKDMMKQERIKDRDKLTSDYQFGFFVGEDIYNCNLPTISIDNIHTRKLISVTSEEIREFNRLEELWSNKYHHGKDEANEEWDNVIKFRREMETKYLPPVLRCSYHLMNIRDMVEFKKGLRDSLWNCDICHYKIETDDDINIFDDGDFYFTNIILKYGH